MSVEAKNSRDRERMLAELVCVSAITSPSKSVGGAEIGGIRLEFSQRTTLNEAVAAVRIAERLLNGDQG